MPKQKQITIVAAVIRNKNGEILLAQRHQPEIKKIHGKWEFPGGGINFGETPEQAVLREVKEETGLKIKIIRLLPKIYSNTWDWPDTKAQVIIISYECKKISGKLGSKDKEIGGLNYFKPVDIIYKKCLPKTKQIISLLTKN